MSAGGTVDVSWVAPHLAIGASFLAVQVRELEDCGFRRVVDLRAEAVPDPALFERHRICLLHLPTADLQPLPDDIIERGVAWVCEALDRGETTLVHCQYGIGRSPLLACCVLVARGMALDEALSRLVRARAQVSPSPRQVAALFRWAESRGAAAGLTWPDLAAILYRSAAA
jgi:protein-tyrosine phosphatase